MRPLSLFFILLGLAFAIPANAHESRPAYLEIRETNPDTYDVVWKVPARGDMRLSIHVGFPEDAKILAGPTASFSDGAYFERSRIAHPGGLSGETLRIQGLESTKTDALVRIMHLDGVTQTTRVTPEAPTFTVEASPSAWRVAGTYTIIGFEHILLGIDHLLFVLALVLLVKGWKRLLGTVTAFTLAHSITLAAATLGFVHVPGPPVEAIIALSIVFVASEILRGYQGKPGLTAKMPWVVSFTFGLLHGFGFAGALSEVGLPQQAIPIALLFFNVGVELGQIAFVVAVLACAATLKRLPLAYPNWSRSVVPYAVGSLAMFWVIERVAGF